jgi:regulation of enolase protein 1 (concanavalin A-like superfamily)
MQTNNNDLIMNNNNNDKKLRLVDNNNSNITTTTTPWQIFIPSLYSTIPSWNNNSSLWLNPPLDILEERDVNNTSNILKRIVFAHPFTDFWQKQNVHRDTAHALLAVEIQEGDSVIVVFNTRGLQTEHDHCGILLRVTPNEWIKAGIELVDGIFYLAVGVTHPNSRTDWSLSLPPPQYINGIRSGENDIVVKMTRIGEAVYVAFSFDSSTQEWLLVRVCHLDPNYRNVRVGPFIAGPKSSKMWGEFIEYAICKNSTS